MVFKFKTATTRLIFIIVFFASTLFAAPESNLLLPKDALKISESSSRFGPIKSLVRRYESSWSRKKLIAFYKAGMQKAGWTHNGSGTFVKGDDRVVIIVQPEKNTKGKTGFFVSTSKIIPVDKILDTHKKDPDKLKFMPLYPGSEQLSLWDTPDGIIGSYKAERSVKDIVFFYKSAMLNYGWTLNSEKVVKKDLTGKFNQTNLIFRRSSNETCKIKVTDISTIRGNGSSLNSATISVSYYVHKKIKL